MFSTDNKDDIATIAAGVMLLTMKSGLHKTQWTDEMRKEIANMMDESGIMELENTPDDYGAKQMFELQKKLLRAYMEGKPSVH